MRIATLVGDGYREIQDAGDAAERKVKARAGAVPDDRVAFLGVVHPNFEDELVLVGDERPVVSKIACQARSGGKGIVGRSGSALEDGGGCFGLGNARHTLRAPCLGCGPLDQCGRQRRIRGDIVCRKPCRLGPGRALACF